MSRLYCSDEVERAALWERFAPLHEQVQTESDEYTPGFQVRTPEEKRENVDAEAALLWLLVVCLYWLNGCLITEWDFVWTFCSRVRAVFCSMRCRRD